jgi:hypothetical protein
MGSAQAAVIANVNRLKSGCGDFPAHRSHSPDHSQFAAVHESESGTNRKSSATQRFRQLSGCYRRAQRVPTTRKSDPELTSLRLLYCWTNLIKAVFRTLNRRFREQVQTDHTGSRLRDRGEVYRVVIA